MPKLPSAFINSLQNTKGFVEELFVDAHLKNTPTTSIRLNSFKKNNFHKLSLSASPIPWNTDGYYLSERPSFTADPLFHAGAYYVQEASSMFLQQVLQQTINLLQPIKVLDLCAAPGGKSTLIQSLISKNSLLVSNELIKTRVNILSENIIKWGAANVIVTNNEAKDFNKLKNYFDVIVVDAPCSGSGLFRKDARAINEWSISAVQGCNLRQQRIVADIMPLLKQEGILIYSTCSYSKEENENVCDWIMQQFAMQSLCLNTPAPWGIVQSLSEITKAYGYRFYPYKLKGEGFFIAAFKKLQASPNFSFIKNERKIIISPVSNTEINILKPWLKNAEEFFFFKQADEIIALPIFFKEDLATIQSTLYIKKAGVKMGTIIRGELIPPPSTGTKYYC